MKKFFRLYIFPPIIAFLYWLWTKSWRLKIFEAPEFIEALNNGRVIFSFWHGDELVMMSVGPRYHSAAITSTSDDGELMDRVVRYFGYGTSRGSSTRGGVRALVGMLALMKEGYNASVAIDGPKGPRHKAKPGVWAIAKHSGAPIIPIGVSKKSALTFDKSWNKTFIPWPFTKVVVSFGKPLAYDAQVNENQLCQRLEEQMRNESNFAQSKLLFLFLVIGLFAAGCASSPESHQGGPVRSVLETPLHIPLTPLGRRVTGAEPAVVSYIVPGSLAEKYGFKRGDKILKINGRPVESFLAFEKKIKNLPPQIEIEFIQNKTLRTKNILLNESSPRLGALTSPQGVALIKHVSPKISFMSKGPITLHSSASKDPENKNVFVNLIVESSVNAPTQHAFIRVYDKKTKKLLHSSKELFDAMSEKASLISRKVSLNSAGSDGVLVSFLLQKQQFAFEFQ